MGMENEWKIISCVELTTSSLFPRQVPSSWVKGAMPTPGNPCFDLPGAALLLPTAPGSSSALQNREEKENIHLQPYLLQFLRNIPQNLVVGAWQGSREEGEASGTARLLDGTHTALCFPPTISVTS